MKLHELAASFVGFSRLGESHIDVTIRALCGARLLPARTRGRTGEDISPRHVSTLLMAIGGSAQATGAVGAVLELAQMGPKKVDDGALFVDMRQQDAFGKAATFGAALDAIFESPEFAGQIEEIEIHRTFPVATIHWIASNGEKKIQWYSPEGSAGFVGNGCVIEKATFGGGMIHQLAIDLHNNYSGDAEWTPDVS